MSLLRPFLLLALTMMALTLAGLAPSASVLAPEQCAVCMSVDDAAAIQAVGPGERSKSFELAGDPPDPFVADLWRPRRPSLRPELPAQAVAVTRPAPARVPQPPPRHA